MSLNTSKKGKGKGLAGLVLLASTVLSTGSATATSIRYDITDKTVAQLMTDLKCGRVSSSQLVEFYEARIRLLDAKLHAVIALNPDAKEVAAVADRFQPDGRAQGPLAGIPIVLKDNVETKDQLATTAGSLALKDNFSERDAPVAARLRAAGAIVLGKANMTEWASIRSGRSVSGWSAIRGQTHNPYALDRSACGSSSGSAAAIAAGFAAAAIGTETDGSITCPAAMNGLVGLKPTVGLVSRTFVVPISASQDTPGPITRSVEDAAILLQVMAGTDVGDPATAQADIHKTDYVAALRPDALKGVRVGVLRYVAGFHPATSRIFEQALANLVAAGAILVDIQKSPVDMAHLRTLENTVLMNETKEGLNAYLASTNPQRVTTRTLADLIQFDSDNAELELSVFDQDQFIAAQRTDADNDPSYLAARTEAKQLAGPEGIDELLTSNHVAVLVGPTAGPAYLIDPILGNHLVTGGAGYLPAIAGYPHLTVPMGQVDGLPVGLSFIGTAWSEASLLAYGFAFENLAHARTAPTFAPSAGPKAAPSSHPNPAGSNSCAVFRRG